MKIVLYLLSGVLTAPGAMLAYFFWTVIGASKQKGLAGLFFYALKHIYDTLVWGYWLVLPGFVIWLILAFLPKYRLIGASGMAIIAVISLIELFAAAGPPKSPDDLFIPVISLGGLSLNLWLIWSEATSILNHQ